MKKLSFLLIIFYQLTAVYSQEEKSPLNVGAVYIGDYFSNFSGGIKTGQTYLGLFDFSIGLNTEDAGLWKNGEFYAQLENTHGGTPSGEYIGDMQVASFIENGDYTYLYELWYQQKLGKFSFKLGLQDLNADCHVCENGGLFLNSSFGIMPSASLNMPVPIFPLTSLAIQLKYDFTEKFSLLAGIWDGDPGDFDNNHYNIEWTLDEKDGFLYMLEGHYSHKSGFIKVGGLYHSGTFNDLLNPANTTKGNFQFHFIVDQIISKKEGGKGSLGVFLQIGYLPDNAINPAPLYIGGGFNYRGLLSPSANDVLGLAFANVNMSKDLTNNIPEMYTHETAIELSYAITFWDHLTVQPDLQYIINPGADRALENAFIGFLRFIIEI